MSADIIQFSHANGFPAKTYSYFFECLAPYQVNYVNKFGHGDIEIRDTWEASAEELIKNIETNANAPVIGVGHSFGAAVTLFASQQRPELFKQLILMDPPLFLSYKRHFIRVIKALRLEAKVFPEARKTRTRKSEFTSRQEAYNYYQTKGLFKNFNPKCFDDYIEHGIRENELGFELDFSPKVEYKIFKAVPSKLLSPELQVPTKLVYSNAFTVLEKTDLNALQKTFPKIELVEFNGGHLFPLEKPVELAELIKDWIA